MSESTMSPPPAPSVYDVFGHGHIEGVEPINLTIGNPHLKPPAAYFQAMEEVIAELRNMPGNGHGYVTQRDPFGLCQTLAKELQRKSQVAFQASDVLITVGATGALDIILKTLLQNNPSSAPGEVIVIAPYFVEYLNLIQGNGGKAVVVPTGEGFHLDIPAIANAITPATRGIIVNSPNNPTGCIYDASELAFLAAVLEQKTLDSGNPIVVIEDSVYDSILFGNDPVPSLIPLYPALIRVNSFSKSLSLAGERLGYLAVHPGFPHPGGRAAFLEQLNLCMRARVVHAPLLQHRIVAKMPFHGLTDMDAYRKNVLHLYGTLVDLGFSVMPPQGTFYLWAIVPPPFSSELEFRELAHQGATPLLYLPGVMFGGSDYHRCLRFAVCVPFETVEKACQRLREICAITL